MLGEAFAKTDLMRLLIRLEPNRYLIIGTLVSAFRDLIDSSLLYIREMSILGQGPSAGTLCPAFHPNANHTYIHK